MEGLHPESRLRREAEYIIEHMAEWEAHRRWEAQGSTTAGPSDSSAERPRQRRRGEPSEQGGEARQSLPPAAAASASSDNPAAVRIHAEPEEEPSSAEPEEEPSAR